MRRRLRQRYGVSALWGAVGFAALVASACLVSQNGSPSLIDGGALGTCKGNEAKVIPASMCPNETCCGENAFALCLGTSYSDCSCALLDGSTLLSASGEPMDAADVDLGGDCGAADAGEEGGSEGGSPEAGSDGAHRDAGGHADASG
jgi:hypothetical protein